MSQLNHSIPCLAVTEVVEIVEAEEEAEEEVAGAIMEAIQAVVEDKLGVEEEDMEGRLAVVSRLSRSFRKNHMDQSQDRTQC